MTEKTDPLFQGDDTDFMGNALMKVSLKNPIPEGHRITKAVIAIGVIRKVYENPVFPFFVNLDKCETSKLSKTSKVYMAVWDELGRKGTCVGTVEIDTEPQRV